MFRADLVQNEVKLCDIVILACRWNFRTADSRQTSILTTASSLKQFNIVESQINNLLDQLSRLIYLSRNTPSMHS